MSQVVAKELKPESNTSLQDMLDLGLSKHLEK